jgi:hypothetical protein
MNLVAQGIGTLLTSTVFGILGGLLAGGLTVWLVMTPQNQFNLADRMVIAAIAIYIPPILMLISDFCQVLGNWRCSLTSLPGTARLAKVSFLLSILVLFCHLVSTGMQIIALQKMQRPSPLAPILELAAAVLGLLIVVLMFIYWNRTTALLGDARAMASCRRMILSSLGFLLLAAVTFGLSLLLSDSLMLSDRTATILFFSAAGLGVLLLVLMTVFYVLCLVQTRRAILNRMPTVDELREELKRSLPARKVLPEKIEFPDV